MNSPSAIVVRPALVCEVKLSLLQSEGHARGLGHHLDVHTLVGLHANDKLIPDSAAVEYVTGNIFVLNSNLQNKFDNLKMRTLKINKYIIRSVVCEASCHCVLCHCVIVLCHCVSSC